MILHHSARSLGCALQVTIGDATKTLASRIWDTWIPFGSESETEVTTVASCRIPLADILAAGKHTLAIYNCCHHAISAGTYDCLTLAVFRTQDSEQHVMSIAQAAAELSFRK